MLKKLRQVPTGSQDLTKPLTFCLFFVIFCVYLQESIVDASEDSQLRAAIAASLQCTKFETKNDENSEDDDEDLEDLEFSGSDSDEEHKTPAKNVNNSSNVDKKDVKRGINFDEPSNNGEGTCIKGKESPESELLKSNDSVKRKNSTGVEESAQNNLEKTEEVRETESEAKETDNTSNLRTQEQAGKRH